MLPAVRVEHLGKRYQVGRARGVCTYHTLREQLTGALTRVLRRSRSVAPPEEFWALKDISFDVQPGSVVGIVGPNGAGKSTLLKILSRITRPTTGKVTIAGRVGSLLEVGTGFHPELTGRENIYLNGAILGMTRREIARRFDEIVAFAEVERFLDTPVKRYSSGMYVRLAFAVAAHMEPEVLLVDEVLAVGDAAFQKKCLRRMKDVGQQGRTVLFVSHNMAAVLGLCQRAFLIGQGGVRQEGPAAEVVEAYVRTLASPAGGRIDLRCHPSRAAGAVPLLKELRLRNSRGVATDTYCCGEPLTIELDFQSIRPLDNPHFGIGFDDNMGQRVFSVATYLSPGELPPLHSPRTVRCRIAELSLAPGTYTLSLSAGSASHYLMDNLPNAVALEVTATDFYGNGRLPTADLGQVLVRSRWEVTEEAPREDYEARGRSSSDVVGL
ncbi:MAG: ABC transporter ATP-binding protein [Gemmataceae bacterium]|nr:ABC transporter ATP-binding protein [Gemmataceae bacterium]